MVLSLQQCLTATAQCMHMWPVRQLIRAHSQVIHAQLVCQGMFHIIEFPVTDLLL